MFLRSLLLLLVHSQQLAEMFDGLVRGCALPAEDFVEGFAQACTLFAEEVHVLAVEFQLPAGDE